MNITAHTKMNTATHAKILFFVFWIFWLVLAIEPFDRAVWVAENIILVISMIYLVLSFKKIPFSKTAYSLIFVFCILQTIGAHYTYAQVPAGFWAADWLHLSRNHYDRFVHFAFGFLLTVPLEEIMKRGVRCAREWQQSLIVITVFFALGGIYEILEWLYAIFYEKEQAAEMVLGSQGDIWDAEKDMLLTGLGSVVFLMFRRFLQIFKKSI